MICLAFVHPCYYKVKIPFQLLKTRKIFNRSSDVLTKICYQGHISTVAVAAAIPIMNNQFL